MVSLISVKILTQKSNEKCRQYKSKPHHVGFRSLSASRQNENRLAGNNAQVNLPDFKPNNLFVATTTYLMDIKINQTEIATAKLSALKITAPI